MTEPSSSAAAAAAAGSAGNHVGFQQQHGGGPGAPRRPPSELVLSSETNVAGGGVSSGAVGAGAGAGGGSAVPGGPGEEAKREVPKSKKSVMWTEEVLQRYQQRNIFLLPPRPPMPQTPMRGRTFQLHTGGMIPPELHYEYDPIMGYLTPPHATLPQTPMRGHTTTFGGPTSFQIAYPTNWLWSVVGSRAPSVSSNHSLPSEAASSPFFRGYTVGSGGFQYHPAAVPPAYHHLTPSLQYLHLQTHAQQMMPPFQGPPSPPYAYSYGHHGHHQHHQQYVVPSLYGSLPAHLNLHVGGHRTPGGPHTHAPGHAQLHPAAAAAAGFPPVPFPGYQGGYHYSQPQPVNTYVFHQLGLMTPAHGAASVATSGPSSPARERRPSAPSVYRY
ncbi:unnamed protein product [Vitrella brassicaformis CCMP3155]|uniref:Uncharacterized protein n=3 Tax=Vitrella brassicaformis TaxID=1169539 RepID=A0A0G4FDT5_VITBC|nr:unnamed protein product [Vitrella brassicaformis CCMP3155]|eukprot:CEM11371.1 unnamed protein product [Vitrella brassicaformis CCMP3155]